MKLPARAPRAQTPFRFGYGAPSLDLGVTLRRRASKPVELLETPADAARWLQSAGLTPEPLPLKESQLRDLRELRDAIYRIGRAAGDGRAPAAADIRLVNAAARRSDAAPQLAVDWSVQMPRAHAFELALGAIARDAIAVFADEDRRARLRTCEQDDCRALFLDRSRGERRRWCSMSRCGSRAKVAAFRQRQKEEHP